MKDLSIIQHQEELEEKAGNEQFREELLMVAQEAYQEDDNLKLEMRTSKNTRNYMNGSTHTSQLQSSQDHDMLDGSSWECCTANTLHVTDDHFERLFFPFTSFFSGFVLSKCP